MQSRRTFLGALAAIPTAAAFRPIAWSSLANPAAVAFNPTARVAIRERIRQGIRNQETTGLALAVISRGEIVWEEGFGLADVARARKVTPHSSFSLQSLTKPFTTTLVGTFAAEGKLSLDAPANDYLKSAIQGPNGDPKLVTVRSLGAHCSGLPATYQELYNGLEPLSGNAYLQQYGRLAFPPGTIWEYSNVAFDALGAIVSELSDEEYGSLMSNRVLAPLGMRDSFWDTDKQRLSRAVVRYDSVGKPIPFYRTTTPPSGELYSSAHDVARFALWNMRVPLGGPSLLNPHWIDELHKPVFTSASGTACCFGWALDALRSGLTVLHKGGGGSGVSTLLCMVPQQKLACVVLANHDHADSLVNGVCDMVLSNALPEWSMPGENREPARVPFVINETLRGTWAGTLANDGIAVPVRVSLQSEERATISIDSQPAQKLSELQLEGAALLGAANVTIPSPDSLRVRSVQIRIKLLPYRGQLLGRATAYGGTGEPPAMLPYVLTLDRQQS